MLFVRVFNNENIISRETHLKLRIRKNSILSKIENIRKNNLQKKFTNLTNHEFDEYTICSMHLQQI